MIDCLLCKKNHFVRDCLSKLAAYLAAKRSGKARKLKPQQKDAASSVRPSAPDKHSTTFKRNGTTVLSEFLFFEQFIR